jgi:hypothetical protein
MVEVGEFEHLKEQEKKLLTGGVGQAKCIVEEVIEGKKQTALALNEALTGKAYKEDQQPVEQFLQIQERSQPDSHEAYSSFFDISDAETLQTFQQCTHADRGYFKVNAGLTKSYDDKILALSEQIKRLTLRLDRQEQLQAQS